MDKIKIKNLQVYGYHGVLPEENKIGQFFYVNAVLYTDTHKAGCSDNIVDSIHYGEVCHHISNFINQKTYQLVETVAEKLAESLLLSFPKIESLELEIRKPNAPVGLPLESVSVEITRSWHHSYIAVGSNIGDKEGYIKEALNKIGNNPLCKIGNQSPLIVTAPYGGVMQDDFLNGVFELHTLYTPEELLNTLHDIEKQANRERDIHWGPRTLDLDILFYDNVIMDGNNLTIPHKDLHNRLFVLEPLNAIAPNLKHPILMKTISELYLNIAGQAMI